jgi:hypothetical protein
MADARPPQPDERGIKQSLVSVRIIWAALLMGQLFFLAIIVLVIWPSRRATAVIPDVATLFYAAVIMLVMAGPVAWFVRGAIYRSGRARVDAVAPNVGRAPVPPQAYVTGNIVFLAMFEGASFVGLVCMMLSGRPLPSVVVPAVAMAIQVLNFPTGAAMRGDA